MKNDSNSDATNAINDGDDNTNDYNHENATSHGPINNCNNGAGHDINSSSRGKNNHLVGNQYDMVNNDNNCD